MDNRKKRPPNTGYQVRDKFSGFAVLEAMG
jgi:hypothetical protein